MALKAPTSSFLAIRPQDLEPVMRRLDADERSVALDTETIRWSPEDKVSPMGRAQVVCFSLAGEGWDAVVDGSLLPHFKPWLEDERRMKTLANTPFECHVAGNHGINLRGVFCDVVLADHTLDASREGRHGVKELCQDRLGREMRTFNQVCPDGDTWRAYHMERESFVAYSRRDAVEERDIGRVLHRLMWRIDILGDWSMWQYYERFQQPFAYVLYAMERRGVTVDGERLAVARKACAESLDVALKRVCTVLGRPGTQVESVLRSPQRLSHLLYEERKLPVLEHTKDLICIACGKSLGQDEDEAVCHRHPEAGYEQKPSTGKSALGMLAAGIGGRPGDALCAAILDYRADEDQLEAIDRMLVALSSVGDGRIHTSYRQADVKSGRLSSRNTNLQNVAGKDKDRYFLRNAFRASGPGRVRMWFDYQQLEYKLIAHLSRDPRLIEAFNRGEDFHAATARLMGVDRRISKNANFCLNYGGGVGTLARTLRVSKERAQELYDLHHRGLPRLHQWRAEEAEKVRRCGYSETIDGWRRPVPQIHSAKQRVRAYGERVSGNNPPQSGAAKVVQMAMLQIAGEGRYGSRDADRLRDLDVQMDMQVHDEIGFDMPADAVRPAWPIIQKIMEHPLAQDLSVPLPVDAKVGPSWGEGVPIAEWLGQATA